MARNGDSGAVQGPPPVSALALVRDIFGLSPFEVDVLVLVAGVELEGDFAGLCAATGQGAHAEPTFALALAVFDDAHWSALAPDSPLRHWSLVTLGGASGLGPAAPAAPLTRLPLRIDERVLHFLVGLDTADPRLAGVVVEDPGPPGPLPRGQEDAAQRVRAPRGRRPARRPRPRATDRRDGCHVAGGLLARDTGPDAVVDGRPRHTASRAELAMLLTRDALLGGGPLVVRQIEDAPVPSRWLGDVGGRVAVVGGRGPELSDLVVPVDVPPLTRAEQAGCWARLEGAPDAPAVDPDEPARLSAQFHLAAREIAAAGREAATTGGTLWTAARTRPGPAWTGSPTALRPGPAGTTWSSPPTPWRSGRR